MSDAIQSKVPGWFWAVSVIFLLWSLAGCFACYSQLTMTAEQLAQLTPEQRDAFMAMPAAIKGAYILAVGAGLLGSILLLARKVSARPLFVLSLIAVVVQFGWVFFVYTGKLMPNAWAFPAFIVLMAVLQIWLAGVAARRGWLS